MYDSFPQHFSDSAEQVCRYRLHKNHPTSRQGVADQGAEQALYESGPPFRAFGLYTLRALDYRSGTDMVACATPQRCHARRVYDSLHQMPAGARRQASSTAGDLMRLGAFGARPRSPGTAPR